MQDRPGPLRPFLMLKISLSSRHFLCSILTSTIRCFRDRSRYLEAKADNLLYHAKPRLRTALQCLDATNQIATRLGSVSIPFLVVHGSADTVTDPAVSQALFDAAISTDKAIKIYDGAWHAILAEPDGLT